MSPGQHLPTAQVKLATRAELKEAKSENVQKWAKWELGRTLENPGFSLLLVFLVLSTSVRGLEMPVDECPSCARGSCPFLCPWSALCFYLLHMYSKSDNIQYCKYIKNDDHEPPSSI